MAQSGRPDLVDGLYDFRCLMSELEIDDASSTLIEATAAAAAPVAGSGTKVGDVRATARFPGQTLLAPDRASPTLVPSIQLQATVPRHQQVSTAKRTDTLGPASDFLFFGSIIISPSLSFSLPSL